MRQVEAQVARYESRRQGRLAPLVVCEANRFRRVAQVASQQVAQHRAPRDEAIAMDVHQESVRARYLVRVQYRAHSSQARRHAVKTGEPHTNFARLEFHCISRTLHDSAIIPAWIARTETGFSA